MPRHPLHFFALALVGPGALEKVAAGIFTLEKAVEAIIAGLTPQEKKAVAGRQKSLKNLGQVHSLVLGLLTKFPGSADDLRCVCPLPSTLDHADCWLGWAAAVMKEGQSRGGSSGAWLENVGTCWEELVVHHWCQVVSLPTPSQNLSAARKLQDLLEQPVRGSNKNSWRWPAALEGIEKTWATLVARVREDSSLTPLKRRRLTKAIVCPQCNFFIPAESPVRGTCVGLQELVGNKWAEVLEGYMVGREMQPSLPRGQDVWVKSVRIQKGGRWALHTDWQDFWNRRVAVDVDLSILPSHLHSLNGVETTWISLMMLMQLHPVIPNGAGEVLDLDQVTLRGLVMNSVMFGRLRSPDFLAWLKAFHNEFQRWPFVSTGKELFHDVACFVQSYDVEDLGRCCDTTLELCAFQSSQISASRRNHDLIAPVASEGDELVEALTRNTYSETVQAGLKFKGFGQFVVKNITNVLSMSRQAGGFQAHFKWLPEMLCNDVPETFVAIGTNGAEFSRLASGASSCDVACECELPPSASAFYKSLDLFKNVTAIAVDWESGDKTGTCEFTVPPLWRKGWVAQLSACKALQWIIAGASGRIAKPRRVKPGPYDFKPAIAKFRAQW